MRPLIIDEEAKQKIEKVIEYAETHVYSMDDLLDIKNGDKSLIAGNQSGYSCELPFGYRITYSIENQPVGLIRHISISIDGKDKLPNLISVSEIIKLFGFKGGIKDCKLDIEEYQQGHYAINIWQLKNSDN